MARRATVPAPTDPNSTEAAPAEATVTESENTVTTATPDAPVADAPVTVDPGANTAPVADAPVTDEVDEVVDTSALTNAIAALLATELPSDPTTIDFTPIVTAYNSLTRKGKAAGTRELSAQSQTLLESGDFPTARVVLLANKATKAAKPKAESKPRVPADVTAPIVEKLAAFQLAFGSLSSNLPAGIATDWQDQVNALYAASQDEIKSYVEWINLVPAEGTAKPDAPIVSAPVALAIKIAYKSSRKPYGARHDVTKHIEEVFAALPSGTFLSADEISKASSAEYGDGHASISAVNARLGSNKPLSEGLTVGANAEGVVGVTKA